MYMYDLEKELFINTLKQSFRMNLSGDTAEEMCDKLDYAKKNADVLEQIYNLNQQHWQQFCKTFMSMPLP